MPDGYLDKIRCWSAARWARLLVLSGLGPVLVVGGWLLLGAPGFEYVPGTLGVSPGAVPAVGVFLGWAVVYWARECWLEQA